MKDEMPHFARIKMQALESGELETRGNIGVRGREIELGDLIAWEAADVGDVGFDGEAVAEVEERLALEVAVGAVGHGVVVEGGKTVDTGVEGNGQAAGGIVFAAE